MTLGQLLDGRGNSRSRHELDIHRFKNKSTLYIRVSVPVYNVVGYSPSDAQLARIFVKLKGYRGSFFR